jgi:hypothetical protein
MVLLSTTVHDEIQRQLRDDVAGVKTASPTSTGASATSNAS